MTVDRNTIKIEKSQQVNAQPLHSNYPVISKEFD